MTTYSYFPNVPNGPNDPADDQPSMLTNTASIASLIGVDHVGFNTANGGRHTVINFINQGADPALTAFGQLYTKTVGTDIQLFFESPGGTVEQVTGQSSSGPTGYVLLPGGFILQWGTFTNNGVSNGTNPISFTPHFSSPPFWVGPVSVINNFGSRTFYHVYNQSVSGATIQMANISGGPDGGIIPVQWLALGKA